MLDRMDKEPKVEAFGRELTHSEILAGYSYMNEIEAVARCIYGEDSNHEQGQKAVADEIYNRKVATQFEFGAYCLCGQSRSLKDVVYSPNQYNVLTDNDPGQIARSRAPELYSAEWQRCVEYARSLAAGSNYGVLGSRYFHRGVNREYPSESYDHIQIPANVGNKFYNNSTTRIGG